MNSRMSKSERSFLAHVRHSLLDTHLPRIQRCLQVLTEKELWWRPNRASNSVGNLMLHLEGNVRQWIISGLGGIPDRRNRDWEFAAQGPIPRHLLVTSLQLAVEEAVRIVAKLSTRDLARMYTIQRFRVTGLEALCHVVEHFAYHCGQIIFLTKLKLGRDLRFTNLPGERAKRPGRRSLPQV